jgi:hypothetical protein
MINLIPNQEKKRMIKDFYFRLAVVILLAFSLVMAISSIVLLPAYFISSSKKAFYGEILNAEKIKETDKINKEISDLVSRFDAKLSLLESMPEDRFIVSDRIVKEILSKKISNIKITRIFYEDLGVNKKTINIGGTASSRERLVLFRNALQSDPLFKNVELPISSFIKGSNIKFSLTLTPS